MTVEPTKNRMFFGPEQPLSENSLKSWSPLYQMNLNTGEIEKIHEYPLSGSYDNGLVSITPINDHTFLTLERGFNSVNQEAEVKLYRVVLETEGPSKLVKKTQILEFSKLRPSLARGFKTIENFEGIALGPQLQDGRRMLFVVSDNNFNTKQKTVFLILALTPEMLGKETSGK